MSGRHQHPVVALRPCEVLPPSPPFGMLRGDVTSTSTPTGWGWGRRRRGGERGGGGQSRVGVTDGNAAGIMSPRGKAAALAQGRDPVRKPRLVSPVTRRTPHAHGPSRCGRGEGAQSAVASAGFWMKSRGRKTTRTITVPCKMGTRRRPGGSRCCFGHTAGHHPVRGRAALSLEVARRAGNRSGRGRSHACFRGGEVCTQSFATRGQCVRASLARKWLT